ncbi:MAG TPA: hypothetical protein VMY41_02945 [Thermohalobaculum sp.]|nr:hypothetical protein [Thermohalobaculum sp.]
MPTKISDTPEAIHEALRLDAATAPPALPGAWTATALLTPYGQYAPAMGAEKKYSQLVVAKITYFGGPDLRAMRVGMYLPEDGAYIEWLFVTKGTLSVWGWVKAAPGGRDQGTLGPFVTTAVVPEADFLVKAGASYKGYWPLFNQDTWHFLALTSENQGQKYGNWYSFNNAGNLSRVLNIPADNSLRLPVLGAYFMANTVGFQPLADTSDLVARANALLDPASGGAELEASDYVNPMLTQVDLGNAIANPLWSAPCTLADIQAVLPGYAPLPNWPLPQWSETVKITGYTLGENTIPFYTEVYYSNPMQRQRSEFVGWGPGTAEGYNYRQDTVLYSDYFNDVQYQLINGQWQKPTCHREPGIGYPRPNFPERMGAVVKGTITGNVEFGLAPGRSLYMTLAEMPRPAVKRGQPPNVCAFWDWWRDDQSGVIFTESEVSTPPRHNLSVIDYVTFERNAPVGPGDFADPCQTVTAEETSVPSAKTPTGHRSQ